MSKQYLFDILFVSRKYLGTFARRSKAAFSTEVNVDAAR